MSNSPITVLMTVRDGAKHLEAAIASLLRQTFRNTQIIIVDDASADLTPEILSSIRDSRVEVIRSDIPLGIAQAKALGLNRSVGTYIAMMDADDIAVPARLAVQKAYLDGRPDIALVGSNVVIIDENCKALGIRVLPGKPLTALWKLLMGPPFIHPSIMIRRDFLDIFPYRPDFEYAEDYDLWSRLLNVTRGTNIRQPLLLYRSHPGQHTREGREAQLAEHDLIATRVITEHLPGLGLSDPLMGRMWRFMTGVATDEVALDEIGAAYLQMARAFLERHDGSTEIKDVLQDVAFCATRRFVPRLRTSAARSVLRQLMRMDPLAPMRCARSAASAGDLFVRSYRTVRQTISEPGMGSC